MVRSEGVFILTHRRRDGKLGQLLKYNRNLDEPRHAPASHAGNLPGLTDEFASSPGWFFVAGVRACRLMTLLMLFPALVTGCGTFMAHRMVQAPNTYPDWLAPSARVLLSYNDKLLTNDPVRFADVGPPSARLHYRVVEPADYHLKVIATNWVEHGEVQYQFSFRAETPRTNVWSATPRGTVILLHGYGLAEFSMVPWAWCLAQEGWRCVLVDLRGHGESTGKTIYYGLKEARDMSQLFDVLENRGQLAPPVAVIGESYGAALALRWKTADPRVGRVVAIAPYVVLSNAVVNICHDYAGLLPQVFIRAGLKQLPTVLGVSSAELDTTTVLARHPVTAFFITGTEDDVIPPAEVRKLFAEALPNSQLIVVPGATHETVPYRFSELIPPVLAWLKTNEMGGQ
jgi:pimeloyl-ACP methyl ester carboxylesterase